MSYSLYQVQAAFAWAERVKKEQQTSERFWQEHSRMLLDGAESTVSGASTTKTSTTEFFKAKLDLLEKQLDEERLFRQKVEKDLKVLKEREVDDRPPPPRR